MLIDPTGIFISTETREASKALLYGHVDGAPRSLARRPFVGETLFDLTKSTVDLVDLERTHQKYRRDPETIREAQRVSAQFQTFSQAEVKSLLDRIQGCRDRFISQGGGSDRARCICSVLNEAREGNGGELPLIDDWRKIYDQLACSNHA